MSKYIVNAEMIHMPGIAMRGGSVAIPDTRMDFDLSRDKSVYTAQSVMTKDRMVFLVAQKNMEEADPVLRDLEEIGVIAQITKMIKLPNGHYRCSVECIERAVVSTLEESTPGLMFLIGKPYLEDPVTGERLQDEADALEDEERAAMLQLLIENIREYSKVNVEEQILTDRLETKEDLKNSTLNHIAKRLLKEAKEKQEYLNLDSLKKRFVFLCDKMKSVSEIAKYRRELKEMVKEEIDRNQKEYVLHEEMKVIKKQLGEDEKSEADELLKKLDELVISNEMKEKITKEINRFSAIPQFNQESMVLRNYLETLMKLPWDRCTEDENDISVARKVLEEDHYGLEDVKERVIEYLGVRELIRRNNSERMAQKDESVYEDRERNKSSEAGDRPILCLVGPPGTGKTSIAKSIARALNKKYVRLCLGGVRDEAEIRGHRKTYVGAMPGRVANAMITVGTANPVMLLDEVDKLSSDRNGDPSSALLEVLDPEQNYAFRDHFIEFPIDLRKVLFIATANDLSTIPRPLLDRMEIINVNGYTENEKYHIATKYLIPKQMRTNGLSENDVCFEDDAVKKLISAYTREAGVRKLEQQIGSVCRKVVLKKLEAGEGTECFRLTQESLLELLGKEKYHFDPAALTPKVGVARGLAWTSVGGDTLEIEVSVLPGKGALIMTGQLGDVMKESATIALSNVRMALQDKEQYNEFFEKKDIHVHVPAGAVPKDGPSAGITMTTAIYSAVTGKKVRCDLAMTGEITLRGRVLPIGGLKEKLLAAGKCGVTTVLVPKENKPDIDELSEEITKPLNIIFVGQMEEVLSNALIAD